MSDLIFPEDPIVGQWFTATNDAVYEWNGVTWIAIGTRNQGNYFLPTASTTILGGVKLDGLTITADENGVISVSGGGSSDRLVNGLNEVVLGSDGTLTVPGDIHSEAGLSITIGSHPVVADIAVDSIDEYPGTWRLFISDILYPDLGTTVTAGATVTASWGSEITANVTDNIHDAGAGWWVVMIDQDLRPSFSHLATVTFGGVGKSWEFGTDGTFTLPNGTNIYGDGIFKADAVGGFELNSFTDNIGGGKKTWGFGTDGTLQLPVGGTVSYSPATPSHWNNIAPITIEHAIDRLAAAIKNLNGTGA
jgi:hypothetical protein